MRLFQAEHRIGGPRARDASLLAEAAESVPLTPTSKTASSTRLSDDQIRKMAFDMGMPELRRIAGNVFENPATQDFWKVADGNIVRLVSSEVDLEESLPAMDTANPEAHFASIMDDLEY